MLSYEKNRNTLIVRLAGELDQREAAGIREELDAKIRVGALLKTVEWDYPAFHLTLHCYWCSPASDALHLLEHEAARWLSAGDLASVRWLPADEQLLPLIANALSSC